MSNDLLFDTCTVQSKTIFIASDELCPSPTSLLTGTQLAPNKKQYNEIYEERLVERFRQGDAVALTSLFEMYVDRAFGLARSLTGSREDAEEIVSEAFLKAFRNAANYRGDAPFSVWLFRIVRNLSFDRIRQRQLVLMDYLDEKDADPRGSSESERARDHDVRTSLAEMTDEYREVLILCDVEEWDAVETANLIGKTPAATRSLLYRARRALRDNLSKRWSEDI
ncbi:MAG: RNA polymerase sigma factor [Chthonomonadales bacterium]